MKPEAHFSTGKKEKQDSTEDTNISRSLSMESALKNKTAIHVYLVLKSGKPEARFSTGKKEKQDSTEDTNISRSLSMKSALKNKTAIHVYLVLKV